MTNEEHFSQELSFFSACYKRNLIRKGIDDEGKRRKEQQAAAAKKEEEEEEEKMKYSKAMIDETLESRMDYVDVTLH